MLDLIAEFPSQMQVAIRAAREIRLSKPSSIQNVVITGLGGSGIGGKIVSQWLSEECPVPVVPNNDYKLPGFVNGKTLLIACSYSGNTEETLSALNAAIEQKAQVVCISSGGEMTRLAAELSLPCVSIPGGQPPRSQFGFASITLLYVLHQLGLASSARIAELDAAEALLRKEQESIKTLAANVARKISRRTPVIYSESGYEGVAVRWKQQFNENSKMLCWSAVIPEMNHNELVGWAGGDNSYAALILRNQDDFIKNKIRMDISQQIMSKKSDVVLELESKGESRIERSFYLIHLGDWLSYYLAVERGFDPVVIDEIEFLKSELSKY